MTCKETIQEVGITVEFKNLFCPYVSDDHLKAFPKRDSVSPQYDLANASSGSEHVAGESFSGCCFKFEMFYISGVGFQKALL